MTLKPNRPRVLQVVSSLGMGGAETWLVQLLRYWEASCVATNSATVFPAMDFLITSGKEGIFDEEVRSLGARTHYISLEKGKVVAFARSVRRLLAESRYVAIHDHQDFIGGWHLLFAKGVLPQTRIVHIHNPAYQLSHNYGVSVRRRAQLRLGRWFVSRLATHVGGTSLEALRDYGFDPARSQKQWVGAVHCAFPLEPWQLDRPVARQSVLQEVDWPQDTKIVLFAGRLDYSVEVGHPCNHKNSAFALEVIERCSDERIRLLMAGQSAHVADEFQRLIASKHLQDRVAVLGVRQDLPRLMAASSVLLFPSRAEGLGMVAVEAQAAGLAVLASTAVPRESVVISELATFMSLEMPPAAWATKLTDLCCRSQSTPTGGDPRWRHSPFNIRVCSEHLRALYIQGRSPCSATAVTMGST